MNTSASASSLASLGSPMASPSPVRRLSFATHGPEAFERLLGPGLDAVCAAAGAPGLSFALIHSLALALSHAPAQVLTPPASPGPRSVANGPETLVATAGGVDLSVSAPVTPLRRSPSLLSSLDELVRVVVVDEMASVGGEVVVGTGFADEVVDAVVAGLAPLRLSPVRAVPRSRTHSRPSSPPTLVATSQTLSGLLAVPGRCTSPISPGSSLDSESGSCGSGSSSSSEPDADSGYKLVLGLGVVLISDALAASLNTSVCGGSERQGSAFNEARHASGAALSTISLSEVVLLDKVGEGSFGAVYRGRVWGVDVAVKTLRDEAVSGDAGAVDDMVHEIEVLSRLRHPNIVLYMGALVEERGVFIVTEFLEGGSLFMLLHETSEVCDMEHVLRLAHEAALGVAYLHGLRPPVIHRDLKSENMLLDESGTVKVADFGLSVIASRAGVVETAGTFQWMAPEMLRGEAYGPAVDVYSFGVLLTELVTRQLPFRDQLDERTLRDMGELLDAVRDGTAKPTLPAWLAGPLAALINDCLETKAEARPEMARVAKRLRVLRGQIGLRELEVPRIHHWLRQRHERLHEVALRQIAWLHMDTLVELGPQFLSSLTSLIWKTPASAANLLYHLFQALDRLLRNATARAHFVSSSDEGIPLLASPAAAALIQDALLELGMLKHLFLLEDATPAASKLLAVLGGASHLRPNPTAPASPRSPSLAGGSSSMMALSMSLRSVAALIADTAARLDELGHGPAIAAGGQMLTDTLAQLEALVSSTAAGGGSRGGGDGIDSPRLRAMATGSARVMPATEAVRRDIAAASALPGHVLTDASSPSRRLSLPDLAAALPGGNHG
ncbi:TKL/DRK protein kinase [Thecamonas trahens ATCC 50062]|uniref:TKL/DRK protein kinase n=1 Tax=Thecamonas trahens ATCC 50062 TaxID=461836 RepID=A0A0L0DBZ6_THETB|nr:TKL/DRK protein kinase [Thecamonas trahens ATCC 50062]KNC49867.1 TKL/DRK protein kinase [Thecamonas trahens ATCC 50062]|eukprot:XP_013757351.1 TKL/DRK protein kinase [Thecamonas trahens ATCC 50062]